MVHLLFCDHLLFIEIEGELELVSGGTYLLVVVNPSLDAFYLLHLFFRPFLVFPEVGCLRTKFFLFVLHLLLVYLQIAIESIGSI